MGSKLSIEVYSSGNRQSKLTNSGDVCFLACENLNDILVGDLIKFFEEPADGVEFHSFALGQFLFQISARRVDLARSAFDGRSRASVAKSKNIDQHAQKYDRAKRPRVENFKLPPDGTGSAVAGNRGQVPRA